MGRSRAAGLGLRGRLTLLHGTLFLVGSMAFVGVTYLMTAQAMGSEFKTRLVSLATQSGVPPIVARRPGPHVITKDQLIAEIEQGRVAVMEDLIRNSMIIALALTALAVVLGYLISDRALRPLQQVTATAQRLSESTLHERIALSGPQDDVKRLADTFDAMLDRLQRAFNAQRRFVNNASHELRTPLAINRTLLEVALEEPDASQDLRTLGTALLNTNARHERLIESLLLLARSEHEPIDVRPVDLAYLLRLTVEQLQPAADRRRITISAEVRQSRDPGDTTVQGEATLLERCMVNLIENAVKYNVKGGHVTVELTRHADNVSFRVRNSGPRVADYEVDGLFEPFRRQRDRVGSARGSGLGLSIVRAITVAHHGTVRAAALPEGGLDVTVGLPAEPWHNVISSPEPGSRPSRVGRLAAGRPPSPS
ncbi:sensor histidine kinase [Sinosporangium siamense]|nr:HAMP domain-containing sensor histidine kinase [Sinosporangium siamense]